jgi:hypothetical protein
MGGECPFSQTARLLSAAAKTRNKHISKSLYHFSTPCDELINPHMKHDIGGYA